MADDTETMSISIISHHMYNDALKWAGVKGVEVVEKEDGQLSLEADLTDPETVSSLVNGILFGYTAAIVAGTV